MEQKSCRVCAAVVGTGGVARLLHCGRCQSEPYCSTRCQRKDWPTHKLVCFTSEEKKQRRAIKQQTTVKDCAVCSKTTASTGAKLKSCALCRGVRYCSSECQKADWPNHKLTCSGRKGETAHPQAKKTRSLHPVQKQIQQLIVAAMRCARAGDRHGEGSAYCDLGNAYFSLGQFDKAVEFHRKALNIALELGNRAWVGAAYANLGNAYESLGQFQQKYERLKQ